MRYIALTALLIILVAGCSNEDPVSTGIAVEEDISSRDVIAVAKRTDDLRNESLWIVCSVGAQLLESKYERYRAAGLGETDFARMPDNDLTRGIERLYADIKPLIE